MLLKLLLAGLLLWLAYIFLAALYFLVKSIFRSLNRLGQKIQKIKRPKRLDPAKAWDNVILPKETKEELQTIQAILRHPKSYQKRWGHLPPKGMILYGPSGTGKTLIAKRLAQDAGYHFLSISTADVKAKYLGESEQRLHDLYKSAKAKAPCIVFLDEIEGIGAQRSSASSDAGGAGRAQNSLTNQLLQEIDGMESSRYVFTIGASNHLELLDDALKSRLSYQIYMGLPDAQARHDLFGLYTQGYKTRLETSLNELVALSEGMSGRDIETLCTLAAMFAHGRNKNVVTEEDFQKAFKRLEGNKTHNLEVLLPLSG